MITTQPALSDKLFAGLSQFIHSQVGIKLPYEKKTLLESRLRKRLKALKLSSFAEYHDYVFEAKGGKAELVNMIDAVTTNKTDSFREPDHFELLKNSLLPALSGEKGVGIGRPFRVWSAACSTGEEPYTLAMVLSEYREVEPRFRFAVTATDIATDVLQQARNAVYDSVKADAVPPELLRKYMLRSRDHSRAKVRMKPALRSSVEFARLNLMANSYGLSEPFDVIFCRNVLIYFDARTQASIVGKLTRHLREGGYLFVGHSESLFAMDLPLTPVAPSAYVKPARG